MQFKSGDIIEGTEGDGKTWGNTVKLLLLYTHGENTACAVVLGATHSITGVDLGRNGHTGSWVLNARPWKKVAELSALAGSDALINACVEQHKRFA